MGNSLLLCTPLSFIASIGLIDYLEAFFSFAVNVIGKLWNEVDIEGNLPVCKVTTF